MNKQEIEKAIEALQEIHFKTNETRFEMARVIAISALEQQLNGGWIPVTERDKEIEWLRGKHNQAALNWQQENQECRKLQAEIKQLREVNSTLENDLINANMNLERMTELVEAQRWIPVSERLPEDGGYYLVSTQYETPRVMIGFYYTERNEWNYWMSQLPIRSVAAWQPLPEPWKGDTQ